MSVQSSSANHNGHIWQNKELNPDTTSICYVNRKHVKHFSLMQLDDCIAKIETETQCSIVIHGQNSEVLWFCIKHESDQQRRLAFNLINNAINFSLNEVKLPKLIAQEPQETLSSFRLSSPSPPAPSVLNESNTVNESTTTNNTNISITTNTTIHSNQQSFLNGQGRNTNVANIHSIHATTTAIANNNNANNNNVKKLPKSSMTRSSTESFISSLSYSNNNRSSFNGASFKEEIQNNIISNNNSRLMSVNQRQIGNLEKKFDKLKLENNKYKLKNRYTVDFLLQRADTVNSKKQPINWKELSEKYPNVCFSGKVISYFDPYKYHEHWEKTKNTNSELHSKCNGNSDISTTNDSLKYSPTKKHQGYHHTDDFLNLNSFHKDINNNNNYYYSSFKQPRMTHLTEQQQHQKHNFKPLHYNSNNNQNIENTGNYYVKKQQQIDMSRNGFQHDVATVITNATNSIITSGGGGTNNGLRRMTHSKTHYNFNN